MSVYNSMNLKFTASTKNSNMYCALLRRHKALLLSMWPGVLFWVSLIILTGVWASIGVTQPPFLCTLVSDSSKTSSRVCEASVTWHYQEHDISQWIQDGHGWSLGVEQIPCLFPTCSSCNPSLAPSPPPQLSSLAVLAILASFLVLHHSYRHLQYKWCRATIVVVENWERGYAVLPSAQCAMNTNPWPAQELWFVGCSYIIVARALSYSKVWNQVLAPFSGLSIVQFLHTVSVKHWTVERSGKQGYVGKINDIFSSALL